MAYLKFLNSSEVYKCKVIPQNNIVTLKFDSEMEASTAGFDLYLIKSVKRISELDSTMHLQQSTAMMKQQPNTTVISFQATGACTKNRNHLNRQNRMFQRLKKCKKQRFLK